MSFSKIRGILYTIAKYLGDVQAAVIAHPIFLFLSIPKIGAKFA